MSEIRAISWVNDELVLIDQTKLPQQEINLNIETVDQLVDAIKKLAVRGAPALGAAGAWGIGHSLKEILDAHRPPGGRLGAGHKGLFETITNSLSGVTPYSVTISTQVSVSQSHLSFTGGPGI